MVFNRKIIKLSAITVYLGMIFFFFVVLFKGLKNPNVYIPELQEEKNLSKFEVDGTAFTYYFSYDFPYLRNLEVKAKIRNKGKVKVDLLGGEKLLTLIEEEIKNDYIGWSEVNKFWVDDDGYVWKSEQHISPKVPKIVLEVTQKPS